MPIDAECTNGRRAADSNDPLGYAYLSDFYLYGQFVENDNAKAAEYAKISSDMGYHGGQRRYADILYYGTGVAEDKKQAHELYKKSAEQGNSKAAKKLKELFNEDVK